MGDLLFSGIGTIGRVYLISIPTTNWNISESVFTLRPNELVSKEYLYLLLLSDQLQGYCYQNSHGVAQKGVRMATLEDYAFNLPTRHVMVLFTKLVKPFIDKAQVLKQEQILLSESRDRLLPRLMSGEIEV